jgi:hypothetical protein
MKEKRTMVKLLEIKNSTCIYELENGNRIEVSEQHTNGDTMEAWEVDDYNIPVEGKAKFEVRPIYEYDKESDSYDLVDFEKVLY